MNLFLNLFSNCQQRMEINCLIYMKIFKIHYRYDNHLNDLYFVVLSRIIFQILCYNNMYIVKTRKGEIATTRNLEISKSKRRKHEKAKLKFRLFDFAFFAFSTSCFSPFRLRLFATSHFRDFAFSRFHPIEYERRKREIALTGHHN